MNVSINRDVLETLYNTPTNELTLKQAAAQLSADYGTKITPDVLSATWKSMGLNPSKRKRGSEAAVTIVVVDSSSMTEEVGNVTVNETEPENEVLETTY